MPIAPGDDISAGGFVASLVAAHVDDAKVENDTLAAAKRLTFRNGRQQLSVTLVGSVDVVDEMSQILLDVYNLIDRDRLQWRPFRKSCHVP